MLLFFSCLVLSLFAMVRPKLMEVMITFMITQ